MSNRIINTKCKNVLSSNQGLIVLIDILKILQGRSNNSNDLSLTNYSHDILPNCKCK